MPYCIATLEPVPSAYRWEVSNARLTGVQRLRHASEALPPNSAPHRVPGTAIALLKVALMSMTLRSEQDCREQVRLNQTELPASVFFPKNRLLRGEEEVAQGAETAALGGCVVGGDGLFAKNSSHPDDLDGGFLPVLETTRPYA